MGLQMMEHVTQSEIELLQKFRVILADVNLSPELLDDKNLVRWIRARKNNLKAAEQMLRKNLNWKLENKLEDICLEGYPEGWGSQHFPWYVSGVGYNSNIVACVKTGQWDVKSAINLGQREKLFRFVATSLELILRACFHLSKEKPWMSQLIAIHDYEGLSLSQVACYEAMQFMVQLARAFEENYPETLEKLFVVNAPWAFQILYKGILHVIDEKTASKIVIVGSDKAVMREEIGKSVPFSEFPKMYGGDKDDDAKMIITADGSLQNM